MQEQNNYAIASRSGTRRSRACMSAENRRVVYGSSERDALEPRNSIANLEASGSSYDGTRGLLAQGRTRPLI